MKKYKCKVHGEIKEDTLLIKLDEIEYVYCVRCLNDTLLNHFSAAELIEEDTDGKN